MNPLNLHAQQFIQPWLRHAACMISYKCKHLRQTCVWQGRKNWNWKLVQPKVKKFPPFQDQLGAFFRGRLKWAKKQCPSSSFLGPKQALRGFWNGALRIHTDLMFFSVLVKDSRWAQLIVIRVLVCWHSMHYLLTTTCKMALLKEEENGRPRRELQYAGMGRVTHWGEIRI